MSPEVDCKRYEQMREQVLAEDGSGRDWGLNLFQTRGMAAWLKAACEEPTFRPPVVPFRSTVSNDIILPESVQLQVATVLAEMILARNTELTRFFH